MKLMKRLLAVIAQPQQETNVVGVRLQLALGLVVPVLDRRKLQIALSLRPFLSQLPLNINNRRHRHRHKYHLALRRVHNNNILKYLNLLSTEHRRLEDTVLMPNIMDIMHLVVDMVEAQQTLECTGGTWACHLQVLIHTLDLVALEARAVNL